MDGAIKQKNVGEAVMVYTDEGFVHQAHDPAHSYFVKDRACVVHDGIGTATSKGSRFIVVHSITKNEPRVTRAPLATDKS